MTLGEKIKACRKSTGLSQEQLAERLNVSRQAITKWETDKGIPEIVNLVALCDEFGLSLDDLIRGDTSVIDKISAKSDTVASNHRLMLFGGVLVFVSVTLLVLALLVDSAVLDFALAALPWVVIGIGIAFVAVSIGNKRKDE